MPPIPRSISDTELTVLKTLWKLGQGTVRDLQERLQEGGHSWAYTTVQTLLNRLESKGYVASERAGRAFRFRVVVSRDELLSQELGEIAERICEGAALPLMLNLVQAGRFTRAEIERFRRILDEVEPRPARKKTPKNPKNTEA